ncbi:MAG TPA: ferritin-like domain-containing protein [Rickettsiales bacterium]|nr:ferritin-like domain-containing protein [Rickettsiales bacterium]
MQNIASLKDVFITGLSDIYDAEQQLVAALPKLTEAASNAKLAEGFRRHLQETEGQIGRIHRVVAGLNLRLEKKTCAAMQGLTQEADEVISSLKKGPVRDSMLIAGAQKVEHYEMASYGFLVELAKKLGFHNAAQLLQDTLTEEKATDEKLNKIAISDVNDQAMRTAA